MIPTRRSIAAGGWATGVAALLGLQAWLVLNHEPWLDEWQALQIALDASGRGGLLASLRYEGHPPLWYWILQAGAAILPPGRVLAGVQLPIALATQTLLLFRSPFARIERLAVGAGYFLLFEYGAISRSLGLGVLLLFAVMATRHRRVAWGPIALLPMVDVQFGLLSIAAVAMQWRDRRLWPPGVALWLASGAAAAVLVRAAPGVVPALEQYLTLSFGILSLIEKLGLLLLPLPIENGGWHWKGALPFRLAGIAAPLFLVFAYAEARRVRGGAIVLVAFAAATVALSLSVYPLSLRHFGLIAVLLLLIVWRGREDGVPPTGPFRCWIGAHAACGLLAAALSVQTPFDTAPAVVRMLRQRGLQDGVIVSFQRSHAQGIGAMLNRPILEYGLGCTETFIRWNSRAAPHSPSEFVAESRRFVALYGSYTLISAFDLATLFRQSPVAGEPLVAPDPRLFRKLAFVPAGLDGHEYHIYRVGIGAPGKRLRPRACP